MTSLRLAVVALAGCSLWAGGASAQTMVNIGTTVRPITVDGHQYVLAELPMLEAILSCGRRFCLTLNGALTWGIKGGSSVDMAFGDALSWNPVKPVRLFVQGRIGTFVLNNVSVLGGAGVDLNIPLGRDRTIVLGAEYFNRLSTKVGGFLKGPQWYASGEGIALRIGFGFSPRGSGPSP